MPTRLERWNAKLAGLLIARRGLWFVLGLLLTAAAVPLAARLTYNRSMEGFFPSSDPGRQLYLQNKQWFGGEHTLLVVYGDPELFTPAGMDRQLGLIAALRGVEGVASAVSLADRPMPRQPLVSVAQAVKKDPQAADQVREQVRGTPLYQGVFLAQDGETTAIVIQLAREFRDVASADECLNAVRETARAHMADAAVRGLISHPPVTAGTLLLIHDVYEYTGRDGLGRVLEIVSVLLMGVVIACSLRSLRWVLLPLLILYAALFWAQALWAVLNGQMTMVGSAISSLVAVIGVSTVVHFGLRYQELRPVLEPAEALKRTFTDIGPPVFWILATTAGGFAALLVCELKPVTDFAWLMLLATFLIGVTAMLFLPLGVMGLPGHADRPQPRRRGLVDMALAGTLRWVRRRPWQAGLALTVPFAIVGLGMLWLTPQTDFTNNFRKSTEIYRAYDYIETRLGGAGQLELVFESPDLIRLTEKELQQFLGRLRALEKKLGELPLVETEDGPPRRGITKVLGLVDFIDFFDASLGPDRFPRVRLLLLDGRFDEAKKELGLFARLIPEGVFAKLREQPAVAKSFWNQQAGKMRIVLQARERLSSEAKKELIARAQATAVEVLGEQAKPRPTGIYVMLAHLIESLLDDQNKTFALSLLCQLVMGVLAFRSIGLGLAVMAPTVLPVVAAVGAMGWLGIPVNIATAMLASVAMGMTIDSSILYIFRFQQERQAGLDFGAALERTHASAGVAVVVSNLALVFGFFVLVLSRFIPLVHFGIFTSLALFGGMVGNLVLLPLLLNLAPGLKGLKPAQPAPLSGGRQPPEPAPVPQATPAPASASTAPRVRPADLESR